MTSPMTDTLALKMRRARTTYGGMFLHHAAADELQDRLDMVNKSFTDAAIVTGLPEFWAAQHPTANTFPTWKHLISHRSRMISLRI